MERYVTACGGDTRKAMTLYRYNLQISQEMFTIVSCFEVALRNAIDRKLTENLGDEWLRDSIMPDGVFTEPILRKTHDIITFAHRKLQQSQSYTHHKLLAEMEFGIWKYMFSPMQYRVTGRNLLSIFPNKPRSSRYRSSSPRCRSATTPSPMPYLPRRSKTSSTPCACASSISAVSRR